MEKRLVKILILATVFFLPLYLVKTSIFDIPSNCLEILAVATIISSLIFDSRKKTAIPNIYLVAIAMIIIGLLLSAWQGGSWKTSLGIIKGWFLIPIFFSFAILKHKDDGHFKEKIILAYYISAGIVSLISLIYAIMGFLTFDHRLTGFFLSPNHLAMYLAPAAIAGLFFLSKYFINIDSGKFHRFGNFLARYLAVLLFAIILSALYLTYSYGAWFSVIAALIAGTAIRFGLFKNRKILYLGAILFLLFATQLQNPKMVGQFSGRSSWQSRLMIWKSAAKIAADNPIVGIGPGNFQAKYLEYQPYFPPYLEWAVPQPHNLYLAFWLQGGIIGLLGFLILIAFWLAKNIIFVSKNHSEQGMIIVTIMLYILLHGLIDTPVWKNDLSFFFWIIIFLGIKNPGTPGVKEIAAN